MGVERDRSEELYSLFDDIRKTAPQTASRCSLNGLQSSSEVQAFNRFAQSFSRDIANVSSSILRLASLAKQQGVFDEESSEMVGLTQVVKSSFQQLHSDFETLEELKKRAIAAQSSSSHRGAGSPGRMLFNASGRMNSSKQHSDIMVETLKARLARTGQEFRTTLQSQSRSMRENASRRHLFTFTSRPQTFESALLQDQEQQQQQLVNGTSNTQYYRQRAEAVAEIESAVAEVGELFHDFTRLVHEQDEVIVRIDTDIDSALRHVNAGGNELMRYLANLNTSRGLILKVFMVLFVFLMFFGLVVVR